MEALHRHFLEQKMQTGKRCVERRLPSTLALRRTQMETRGDHLTPFIQRQAVQGCQLLGKSSFTHSRHTC